jgi:hypothetical protein
VTSLSVPKRARVPFSNLHLNCGRDLAEWKNPEDYTQRNTIRHEEKGNIIVKMVSQAIHA